MFTGLPEFLELLADGPCIASAMYTIAAELVLEHGRVINLLMMDRNEPHFLLWLMYQVNQENHFLYLHVLSHHSTLNNYLKINININVNKPKQI